MWTIRTITDDDVDLFRRRVDRAFGDDTPDGQEARDRFAAVFEYDRTFAAFDGDDLIGTGGALSFDLTVPGGETIPMGGTTIVTVQPTHRRRGVLRALMAAHLDEVASHGDLVAGLWASESSIYGRFGFGASTYRHRMSVETKSVEVIGPEISGVVQLLEADEAGSALAGVYERTRFTRAGMLSRSDAWWQSRHIHDPEQRRKGKSKRRYAVYFEDGTPRGYATYRQKPTWEDFFPGGLIEIGEVVTESPTAHRALWSYLTSIDLFTEVSWPFMSVDDPLAALVMDPRRIRRSLSDGMWVRVLDVVGAIEARRYETDGAMLLEFSDDFRPETSGVFELEVSGGEARCRRSDSQPDVTMGIDVLGHLYLGGGNALTMATAGRIQGNPENVLMLHQLFTTASAPWCPEVF